jgi:hypothetical protein
VGRDGALAELGAVLDGVRRSRGGVVVVSGEAGIGKTRLAEAACAAVSADPPEPRVVWVWCGPAAEESLHPWPSVARQLAVDDAEVSRLVAASGPLSMPGGADGPLRPAWPGGPGGSGEQSLPDVAGILVAAARSRPLIVVLDDVHAASPTAVRILADLAVTLRSAPVAVVATARDDPFAWRSADATRGTLIRLARVVPLAPLGPAAVGEVVQAMTGSSPDGAGVPAILERTGGNPLLLVETVRMLAGGLDLDEALVRVPVTIQAIIAERIAPFAEVTRRLLSLAAVLGTRFGFDVLAATAEVAWSDVRAMLADAERSGVVAISDPTEGRFSHELVRDAVYAGLDPAERTLGHERAAVALAAFAERGRDVGPGEVAHHLLRAGPDCAGAAAIRARRAGDEACLMAAYDDAVRWYRQAATGLEGVDATPSERAGLLVDLGEALVGAGDRAAARTELIRAATLARDTGDAPVLARAAIGLGAGPAGFEVDLLDAVQVDLLEEAVAVLPPEESGLRALAMARLSVALTAMDAEERRSVLADEAVRVARAAGDPPALAYALSARCDVQAGPDHHEARRGDADEILAVARSTRHGALELLARRLRVVALLEAGDTGAFDADVRAFRVRADELRHPLYQWYVPLWRATRALMDSRLDEADAANLEAEEAGRRAGSHNAFILTLTQRWFLLGEAGDRAGIQALIGGLDERHLDTPWAQISLALVAAQLGRDTEARARLDAVAPQLADLPLDSEWLASMAQVAETVALIGGHTVVPWVRERLAPYADLFVVEGIGAAVRGPVHRHLALLAAAAGDPQAAARHAEAALARARRAGAAGLVTRIEADIRAFTNNTAAATAAGTIAAPTAVFRREGELWRLSYADREVHVPHAKGLADLAVLLATPGRDVAAVDLAGAVRGGDTGPVLDGAARDAYRRRLQDLDDDLDEAHTRADIGRVEHLAAERDALIAQLSAAVGLGGRARRSGSPVERARTTVTARIRDALRRIESTHPELWRHLDRSIRTGTYCSYRPDDPVTWTM